MKKYFIIIIILIFLFLNLYAEDNKIDLPKAPDGYTWKFFNEIKAYFLTPNDWYVNSEKKDNTFAYFITKEDYKKDGFYKTGISINVVTNLQKINSFNYIKEFIKEIKKSASVLKESELIEFGPFKKYIILYKTFSKDLNKNIIMHQILISNTKTNTMYLIMFESPEDEWEKNWQVAETILKQFGIDDEI